MLRRTAAAVVLAVLLVASARGQEPGIRVSGKYTLVISECPFTLHAPPGGSLYFWRVPTGWTITDQGESIVVTQATEGAAAVSVIVATIDFEKKTVDKKTYALSLVVGKLPDPEPRPPPDPGPKPDPMPTGFRVLLIHESGAAMTPAQTAAFYSGRVEEYLRRKTVATDGTQGWRRWDKDADFAPGASPTFKQLWEAVKPKLATLPAVVIVVNEKATVHPLPATEADLLKLLKASGGE